MTNQLSVTLIIIARDEAANLRHLLPQLFWAQAVWVVGNHCRDESEQVARENGASWRETASEDFAAIRSEFLAEVQTEWVFYLDADERVNGALLAEMRDKLADPQISAWRARRQDYHYGEAMTAGGWQEDYVTRIFRRGALTGWKGAIHESPIYEGKTGDLSNPLLHFTHRDTAANLAKSSRWTIKEAEAYVADGWPLVTPGTILRKMVMEFYRRYCRQKGYRDGMVGFVEALVQACNRAFVFIQIWELQQRPTISEKYEDLEQQVIASLKPGKV